ncbi:glycosyltransferase, partial [Pseudomonas carnis]|uniref:glycosyltransferase n=1 Tax=Pseudomonas carnis TaxID=2487355 RepID=UPI0018E65BBD
VAICEQYLEDADKFIILKQQNSGQGVARNLGMSAASGDYLLFVDADDWIDPDLCSDLIKRMDDEQLDFINYGLDFIDQNERVVHKIDSFRFTHLTGEAIFTAAMMDDAVLSSPVNKLYRRSFINKHQINFPPVRACEDMFFSRAISFFSSKTAFVSKVYYHALVRDGSTSRSIGEAFFTSLMQTLEFERQFLTTNGAWEKYSTLYFAHSAKQIAHAIVLAAFRMPAYSNYSRTLRALRGSSIMKSANRTDVRGLLGLKHRAVLTLSGSPLILRAIANGIGLCGYSPY